ncbi:MAG: hypothetical protein K8S99_12660 [Planctomycetes bacterium]|nr:hypothetical protein [Planctomycetota bacterium]
MSIKENDLLDANGAGGESDNPQSLPLMAGVARPEGLPEANDFDLEAKPARKGVSQGTLLILGVLVIGAGALFLMRSTQGEIMAAAGSEVEAKVEQALARLSNPQSLSVQDPLSKTNVNALFRDTDTIVAMFSADPSTHQVPLEYVQKNPFELALGKSSSESAAPGAAAVRDDGHMRRLQIELKTLKLQTIMGGARPVAVINGELYQPGQKIGSFTVRSIEGMKAVLTAEGETFTMSMEAPPKGAAGQPRGR